MEPKIKVKRKVKGEEAHTLEEDLQFSSEEELDEVPLNEFEEDQKGILISAEMPIEGEVADDDSQQAAEAMVQLGTMGYYPPNEEETETLVYKGECTEAIFWEGHAIFITLLVIYLKDSNI